jgi:hypothetical protein
MGKQSSSSSVTKKLTIRNRLVRSLVVLVEETLGMEPNIVANVGTITPDVQLVPELFVPRRHISASEYLSGHSKENPRRNNERGMNGEWS